MSRTSNRVGTGGRTYKNWLSRERNKRKRGKKSERYNLDAEVAKLNKK